MPVISGMFMLLVPGAAHGAVAKAPRALEPVAFALHQIKSNEVTIDFDDNCPGNPTDGLEAKGIDAPEQNRSLAWQSPCRTLTSSGLRGIISALHMPASLTLLGVNLVKDADNPNHRIELSNANDTLRLRLGYARIADRLYLNGAHFTSLDIDNTDFAGPFNAENLALDDYIKLENDHAAGLVDLNNIRVASYFEASSFYGDQTFEANGANVQGNLLLQHKISFGSVDFSDSIFGKSFVVKNITMHGPLICLRCNITENLWFESYPPSASILNNVVDFSDSRIADEIIIRQTGFADSIILNNITAANITIADAQVKRSIWANYIVTGGVFSLDHVVLQTLLLSGASIGKELDIAGVDAHSWPATGGTMDLSNTTANAFTDCAASWPLHLNLDGFRYNAIGMVNPPADAGGAASSPCARIGGAGTTSSDSGWLQFLEKNAHSDATFNPQPFTFLAKYFAEIGNNDYANDILYASRYRQMLSAWQRGAVGEGFGLSFLWIFAGFGIGEAAVIHLIVTICGSVAVGWWVLWQSGPAKEHGWLWCCGACVERLLPIVKLLKEFDDYFDDKDIHPAHPKLRGWQKVFFSLYALWGWILGFLLVAVLSGVTQAP